MVSALSDLTNNIIGGIAFAILMGIVIVVVLAAIAACLYRK